jgi:hypothetical protein
MRTKTKAKAKAKACRLVSSNRSREPRIDHRRETERRDSTKGLSSARI